MLPEFPNFKKLELADKKDVEKITSKYLPYSDFNFTSMWSWDIKGEMHIAQLHGNLVVRFTDYLTAEPFYSFLGEYDPNKTAMVLLEAAKKEGLAQRLKLVPEVSAKDMDRSKFEVLEDRDNFDYVYASKIHAEMDGGKFNVKRRKIRFFEKSFPHEIKVLDLSDSGIRAEILNLFNDWAASKGDRVPKAYLQNEFHALSRFLNSYEAIDSFAVGIYHEDKLIAISLIESLGNACDISHFQKALTHSFKGISEYLTQQTAVLLEKKKISLLNCEQDLGIAGLRESKESYMPSQYLCKFIITLL